MASAVVLSAASRSVISDPNIATKKSHSWVKRENQRTGGENFSFQNSTALRGLPLVGDAGHGKAGHSWAGALEGGEPRAECMHGGGGLGGGESGSTRKKGLCVSV